jgi:hypothetical protein
MVAKSYHQNKSIVDAGADGFEVSSEAGRQIHTLSLAKVTSVFAHSPAALSDSVTLPTT